MSSTHRIGSGYIGFPLRELRGRQDLRPPLSLAHVRNLDPLGDFVYS